MPAPRQLARINKHFTNRLLGPIVVHLPGFGIVVHTGHKTGKTYRTPVNAFHTRTGFVVALVYGPESQWVRNVTASGGCVLESRGQSYRLTDPRMVHDPRRSVVPVWMRIPLRLLRVEHFVEHPTCRRREITL